MNIDETLNSYSSDFIGMENTKILLNLATMMNEHRLFELLTDSTFNVVDTNSHKGYSILLFLYRGFSCDIEIPDGEELNLERHLEVLYGEYKTPVTIENYSDHDIDATTEMILMELYECIDGFCTLN